MTYATGAVEIRGPNLENKGDALMIAAVQRAIGGAIVRSVPDVAAVPRLTARLLRLLVRSLLRLFPGQMRWRVRSAVLYAAGSRFRSHFSLPSYGDLHAIVDCSGFQYTDIRPHLVRQQWRLVHHYRLARRRGVPVILMPQAFGPFRAPAVRRLAAALVRSADRVYARDATSRRYLEELDPPFGVVSIAPDITIDIDPILPNDPAVWSVTVCLVPNVLMQSLADAASAGAYFAFLRHAVRRIKRSGLRPVVVVHAAMDHTICVELAESESIPVLDPTVLEAKGLLAASYAVIGSRFHALVGALSSGTPALGTSWSHKYVEVFSSFGCPECLMTRVDDETSWDEWIDMVLEPDTNRRLAAQIAARASQLRASVHGFWDEVRSFTGISPHLGARRDPRSPDP